jgi:hypothetical protein
MPQKSTAPNAASGDGPPQPDFSTTSSPDATTTAEVGSEGGSPGDQVERPRRTGRRTRDSGARG